MSHWEDKEIVEIFANKKPDRRMLELIQNYPKTYRILDLGCAAGRNTIYLAKNNFDFYAIDSSQAMLAKAKENLKNILPKTEIDKRVLNMQMDSLDFKDDYFDFIIALGIIQGAQSEEEWHRVVGQCARTLKANGKMLVAHFGPNSNPHGTGIKLVKGTKHLYTGFAPNRKLNLLSAQELNEKMLEHGFKNIVETTSVKIETKNGYRTTINAYYQLIS